MSRIWATTLAALTTVAAASALLAVPAHAGKATPPVLAFAASSSPDFGEVAVGEFLDRTFTLTNRGATGSAAINISLTPAGAFTIPAGGDKCTGVALGKKNTCTVTVRYTPAGAGVNDTATLTASAKKPAAPATLTLTGTSPSAEPSPGCVDLATNGYPNQSVEVDLKAGERVTLTATAGEGSFSFVWLGPLPSTEFGESGLAVVPEVAVIVIPEDGRYALIYRAVFGLSLIWSCSAGS
jgi:hypothetical protein